jgi:amino acid adenylation domain-containing protein
METGIQSGLTHTQGASEAEVTTYAFPLTFAQQRLWFLNQLEGDSASYNVPWAVKIEGPLNVPALERTLNTILARHEVLRTTFAMSGNAPVQIASATLPFALQVVDLMAVPAGEREHQAQELARQEASHPMDLAIGPLFRSCLLRLGEQDHVLLLTLHHIVFDGWSRRVFIRELGAIYEALSVGRPSPLPELPLQYADYAVWQRQYLQGNTLDRHFAYWKKQLEGAPVQLELPTDRPRPNTQSYAGTVLRWEAPSDLAAQLTSLGRASGTTLFMTLLAAFNVLLSKYSRQEDIVVGTPIANRNRAEIEALIGLFVNTLVLRTDLSGDPTFLELLTRVKETALGAYAHQDMPFEKLVEELKPERSLGHNPLFQVFFSLQNTPRQALELSGLRLTTLERTGTVSKFDLSLYLTETQHGLRGDLEYNTDLFDAATVERMMQHYLQVLRGVVEAPERRLSELSLLTEEERHQLVAGFNDTATPFPSSLVLPDFFEAQTSRTPDAVALVCGGAQFTYHELNERSNQLAHFLQQNGVGPDVLVALCTERSVDMLTGVLGILKAGGAYVPIDPAYPPDRIAMILEDAKAPLLLTQTLLLPSLPQQSLIQQSAIQQSPRVVCLDSGWPLIAQQPKSNPARMAQPSNLAYVLFTSGSTGRPKGVAIEHRSLVNFLHSMRREPGLQPHDVLVAVTTLSFDIAGLELYLPLITGARLVLASREVAQDGLRLAQLLEQSGATLLQATPSTWRLLIESGWNGHQNLRVLCGGEALPPDLARELTVRASSVWNLYGPTETTIWSTIYRVRGDEDHSVSIGRPIDNTQAYVLDAHRNLVPIGVPGELYLAGDGLARGYLGRPDLTVERFVADPFTAKPNSTKPHSRMYRTGDLARWHADGHLEYIGRVDHQVKLRGFRIELGEIEATLARHPALQQAVVILSEDVAGEKRLVAYVVLRAGLDVSPSALRAHLQLSLPDYMLPYTFVFLPALPLTPNGKINRSALPKPDQHYRSDDSEHMAPRDDVEFLLYRIWSRLLGTEAIGIRDNFFELGGHSLLAVRMVREVQRLTGKDLPLSLLFQGATIERLAELIQVGEEFPPCPTALEIQGGKGTRPFFAVATPGVNALGYVALARHLGKDQPLYKLQKHALARPGEPYSPEAFEALAAECVRAMREIQPKGPYFLGGMCEGARIAYDMARLLESQGEEVALLAILDTWALEHTQIRPLWHLYYYSQRWKLFRSRPGEQKRREVVTVLKKKFRRVQGAGSASDAAGGRKYSWTQHYWPKNFVLPRYAGNITVFKRAKQPFYYVRDSLLGWGKRTSGAIETIEFNSPHGLMLREPHVEQLGQLLRKCLTRLAPLDTAETAGARPEHLGAAMEDIAAARS